MLRYIEISNIALIDKASIAFGPGLCVLTGETGAGKSIIIDSINAVLGAKATRDIVRSGSVSGSVSAVFSTDMADMANMADVGGQLRAVLEENGLAEADNADEVVLSREINASGRNVCRVNGKLVTSAALKSIGELMVDLHGQHENHSLMKREKHIDMLDSFGGPGLLAKRESFAVLYNKYRYVTRQIEKLSHSESERVRTIDILTYQLNEIKAVKPQPGEDERLLKQIEVLANAEKIHNALDAACTSLTGGADGADGPGDPGCPSPAIGGIGEASRALSQITRFSGEFAEFAAKLAEAQSIVEDVALSMRRKRESDEADPGRLDKLSARLEAIERLKRKYGANIREIHRFYKKASERLAELTNSEQTARGLEEELAGLAKSLERHAGELTVLRRKAAAQIEKAVVAELVELEMKDCRFEISFNCADAIGGYSSKGRDQLEFLFCANPGEELKPLIKIASGGEMSRVMLAIKSVLAGADNIPTMIFDEIDAGISGKAASRVAEKMYLLSRGRQIICVTHLAQIACMADDQIMIEKTSERGATQTKVYMLEYGDRAAEISRILGGGAPTEASLRLSAELLARAEDFKRRPG